MTTNSVNNMEDTDMAECDGEKVVTMMDVLQEEQDFEDDANAVLGASDEKNCTYSKGYIKRQALYACLTCCSEAKYDPTKRAGVCLACSLNCHENHELVELYTKRNFRCDCGNPKFNSHPCHFTPNKNDLNEDNNYNQNFSGLYCTCHRPYPDPDSTIEDDEMIQCIICEDWLHSVHLEAAVPGIDQYSEMVCKACMDKNEFLHDYSHLAVNIELEYQDVNVGINGNDSKLHNGDIHTVKLINGTADDSSLDTSVNPTDNMDVDTQTQENKFSAENMEKSTTETSVESSNKEKESDVAMSNENREKPLQNNADINTEAKTDLTTDTTLEEHPKPNEDTLNESTTKVEEKSEETANVNSDEAMNISEEGATNVTAAQTENTTETQAPPKTQSENVEEPKDSLDIENKTEDEAQQEVEPEKREKNLESEKPSQKNQNNEFSVTSDETENNLGNDKDEIQKKDSDAKQEEITTTTTADDVETKTNSAENDTNDINKDSSNSKNIELTTNVTNEIDNIETDISSDVLSKSETNEECNESPENVIKPLEANTEESNEIENKTEENKEMKRKLSIEEDTPVDNNLVKKPKLNEETCIRPKGVKKVHKGATFWPSNLRQKLCTCSECLSMYKDLCVLFLTDSEDTVFAYETLGKERVDGRATQYEKGLEALSSLDRIQQINALTEYNKMKDKLLDFLKSFKDRKEVVKEEDIKAFFAGMKPKREPDGVYFCR